MSSATLQLWAHLYGSERGTLATWSTGGEARGPHGPRTKYFDYPAQAQDAAEYSRKESEAGREAYFCAHLLTAPQRVKGNAAPVRTLWSEYDGAEVPNGNLKPTALVESSPGRYHAYWRLTDPIPPETAEDLNERIAAATGADPSGFDLSQLLRVPGAVNHKYKDRPVVRLVNIDNEREYVPADLHNALPEKKKEKFPKAAPVGERIPSGRRNKDLTSIAGSMRRRGMGEAEILAALQVANARRCSPPLEVGEVAQIASSVSRYAPSEAGVEITHVGGKKLHNDSNDGNDSDFRDLRELPDPERFPVEALPPSVARLVREAAAAIGCPEDFLAVGVLAGLSAAIGDTRKILIKKGWTEGAAIYAMIVGDPASKKSPALYEAMRPILMRQMALKAEYDRRMEEYEAALSRCDKDDEKPKKPVMGRTYVDDITVEKLADTLNENPRGVALMKDELSGWLGSMDQYKQGGKGGDRQKWLQIHTNRPISVDRKSSDEPVIIPRPFVSIFGGIQPEVLPDFGKDRGDGLLDRFVAAYPTPMVGRWTDDEISDEAREEYKALIDALYRLEPAEHEGDEFASTVAMSDEGKAVFVREYNRLHEELETPGFPQRLRPVYGKLEGYLARFALILAMARMAEAKPTGGATMERVGREDVEGAAALINFFKNHARRVYTGLYADSTVDNLAADIRSYLIDKENIWEGTASELHSALESEYKPARPEDLAKSVRAIAKRSPLLRFESLKRTGTRRAFRLTLENAVIADIAVMPSPDEEAQTNSTNSETHTPDAPIHRDPEAFEWERTY